MGIEEILEWLTAIRQMVKFRHPEWRDAGCLEAIDEAIKIVKESKDDE